MISTSTIRISCVVAEDDVERAVRSLHAAFGLDEGVSEQVVRVGLMGATGHGRHRDAADPRGARRSP